MIRNADYFDDKAIEAASFTSTVVDHDVFGTIGDRAHWYCKLSKALSAGGTGLQVSLEGSFLGDFSFSVMIAHGPWFDISGGLAVDTVLLDVADLGVINATKTRLVVTITGTPATDGELLGGIKHNGLLGPYTLDPPGAFPDIPSGPFPYSLRLFDPEHLVVIKKFADGTQRELTGGEYSDTGSAVTLTVPLVAGEKIWLQRRVPIRQDFRPTRSYPFFIQSHEDVHDYAVMIRERQQEEIDRSLKLAIDSDFSIATVTVADFAPAKVLLQEIVGRAAFPLDMFNTYDQIEIEMVEHRWDQVISDVNPGFTFPGTGSTSCDFAYEWVDRDGNSASDGHVSREEVEMFSAFTNVDSVVYGRVLLSLLPNGMSALGHWNATLVHPSSGVLESSQGSFAVNEAVTEFQFVDATTGTAFGFLGGTSITRVWGLPKT